MRLWPPARAQPPTGHRPRRVPRRPRRTTHHPFPPPVCRGVSRTESELATGRRADGSAYPVPNSGSSRFKAADRQQQDPSSSGRVVRFDVKVEKDLRIDPDQAVRTGPASSSTPRWVRGAPAYRSDTTNYRRYLLNHEFGHTLGRLHVPCPGRGRRARVMMQQTKVLAGCRTNPWPSATSG
jgi:hypothetical protein